MHRIDPSRGSQPREAVKAAGIAARCVMTMAAAWLTCGWAPVQGTNRSPHFVQPPLKLLPAPRMLAYANPDRSYARTKPESLDDAIQLFRSNLAIDRYMRDSLGIMQARFEIYAGSAGAADSLRDRVVGMLQALGLQFRSGAAERMDLGPAEGSSLNPGPIPVASAYFALRDSLVHLRTESFKVISQEIPYRSPLTFNGDSALEFLNRLGDLTRREDGAFRQRLLETLRMNGLDYEFTDGVDCSIVVGRLLSAKERREKPQTRSMNLPWFRLPSREQPVIARLDSIQALAWASLGLSAAACLTGLSFWIAFALRRKRKDGAVSR